MMTQFINFNRSTVIYFRCCSGIILTFVLVKGGGDCVFMGGWVDSINLIFTYVNNRRSKFLDFFGMVNHSLFS